MRVNGISAIQGYGVTRTQQEAIVARRATDTDVQVRIAENSDNRLVLLNLALNKNLDTKAVKQLFNRNKPYLTSRLTNLGYKDSLF